jgi:hypothetical protein
MNEKISDIESIVPLGHDRICIHFKQGLPIETTDISFNEDGTFELGYIYH